MDEEDLRTIWCGNLSEKVTEELLYELFLQAGPLESVTIPADKDGKKRAYGFITYVHQVSVPYAIKLFKRTELFRRELNLKTRNRAAGETEPEAPQEKPRPAVAPRSSSTRTGSSQPSPQLRPPAPPRQTSAHNSSTKSDTKGSGITNIQRALHVALKNKLGAVSRQKGQITEGKNASQSLNESCTPVSDTSNNEIPVKKLSEENSDNQIIGEGPDTTSFRQESLSEDIRDAEKNQENASSNSSSSSELAAGEERRSSQSSISSEDSIFQAIKPSAMLRNNSAAEENLNADAEDTSQVVSLNDEDQTNKDMIPSAIYARQAAENKQENGTVVEVNVVKNSENVTPQQVFSEELTSSSNSATENMNSTADVHLHETPPRAPETADSLDKRRVDNSDVLLSQGDDRNPISIPPSTDHESLSTPAVNFSRPHAQLIPEKEESQRSENSAVEYKISVNPLLQHLQNSFCENDSLSNTVHGSAHLEGVRNPQTRTSVNFNVSALSQTTALGISPIEAERKRYQSSISDVFRANLPRLYPRKPATGTNVNLSLPVCPSVSTCTGIQPDRPRTYSSIIRSANNHSGLQSGSRFGAIGAERQSVRVSNLARSNLTGGVMCSAADIATSPNVSHTGKQSLLNYQTEPSKVNYIAADMGPKTQPMSRNTHSEENCQNSTYAMKRFPNYGPLSQTGRPAPIGSERAKGQAAIHNNTVEFLFPSDDHNIRINSAKEESQKIQPSAPKVSPKSVPPAPVNQQKKPLMSLILEDLQKIQSSVGTTLPCSSAGQKLISKPIIEAENKVVPGLNVNNSPAIAQRCQQKTDSKDNHRIQQSNYRTSSSSRCKHPTSDGTFPTTVPNTPPSEMKGQRMQSSIFSNGRISSFSENSPEPVTTKPLPTPIGAERRRKGNAPIYQPSNITPSQIPSHFVAIPHFPGGDCLRNQLMFGYKEVKRRTVVDGDSWD